MADDEKTTTPNTTTPPEPARNAMLGRLLLVGFMGLVVMAECLFAYFWLPSADEVAARTEAMVQEVTSEKKQKKQKNESEYTAEVSLGDFTVTNHQTIGEATLRTEFQLFGTVAPDDQAELTRLLRRNQNRFRDGVIVEIRNSEVRDLTDPELGLIKRRILEKSNALFGKPILQSVGFADYSFVEI